MYTPRAFAEDDPSALDRLLARDPFVTLVTSGGDGLPFASHLPVLHARDGEGLLLEGHWARPNPQASHAGPALAIVHGPHHYISPEWYPDKGETARVPTWNYAAAHLYGELQPLHDEDALASIVARLGERFESAVGGRWRYDHDDPRERAQLRGIVGFRFRAARIELKFKLNQNHPAANVQGAIDGLRGLDRADAAEVAGLMAERLARRER
ncbi:FMN-binding negative transcriptional regulator [Pseudoxanthomonas sp.]|uniref:FMN-binding negative transcriptional regulator n=1 Tax=Pseudoxanthomonas sp. TaxID=1871049 RepID=UPI00258A6AB8|nr:FMN-binding negative transcriptional regulator [Pseudoxanthomonas sp.]MCR6686887.1 FMN-binding negative transcriptional regulator [Pseudoxanthomonas sp.]